MKNLIKKILYLVSFTFFFISCVDSSKKGAWSSSDINKCMLEIKVGIYEEEGKDAADEFFTSLGTTTDEITECMCKIFERDYSSFSEADSDPLLANMSQQKAGEMMMSCLNINEGGWSEEMKNIFMASCAEDPEYEEYCSCLLEELMERYTIAESALLSEDDFANFETFEDCISLID